ncbi:VOC family protein [Arthrobacter sp. AQ5-05]|uniref:VOC family protein n=1 Tax=Arthrobacter sp. AQ5-05 TaxID=2184581 RepID=UPI0012B637B2|nr:VOC family protein [Arthrobacter sp. AQ5-05]
MTATDSFPNGAPCWVETLQPDPDAAVAFYSELMGWTFDDAEPCGYLVARFNGRRVAGIGQAPAMLDRGAWVTYVLVGDLNKTIEEVNEATGSVLAGPLEGQNGERTALFADPSGAVFGARQGNPATVAEVVDAPGAWQMSALHTPDLRGAQTFYGRIFGWQIEPMPESGISLWRLAGSTRRAADPTLPDDVVGVAVEADPAGGVPPHWAVNIQVLDADDLATRVVELGGSMLMPPTDTPGFRNAVLTDPNGGVLAISQVIIQAE